MKATVFYCIRKDEAGRSDPFRSHLEVDRMACMRITTIDDATDLEDVFRRMNVVNGSDIEIPAKIGVRSMSPGDLVLADGALWLCAGIGWLFVTSPRRDLFTDE